MTSYSMEMVEKVIYQDSPNLPPLAFGQAVPRFVQITNQRATFGSFVYPITEVDFAYLRHPSVPDDLGCLIGWLNLWLVRQFAGTSVWIESAGQDRSVYQCRSLEEGKSIVRALQIAKQLNEEVGSEQPPQAAT